MRSSSALTPAESGSSKNCVAADLEGAAREEEEAKVEIAVKITAERDRALLVGGEIAGRSG